MADPVKDLPDPLEEQAALSADNPDDLVAQLADEAIDKLIADADRGETPTPPAPPAPAVAVAPEPVPEAPPVDEAPLQNQLDSLFNKLTDDSDPSEPEPPAPMPMPPPVDVPADIAGVSPATVVRDVPPEPVEEASPDASHAEPDTAPAMQADVRALLDDAVHSAPASSTPTFIVRPLEWLNAPFASLSDDTRDTLGQVAVVTLINALAVILYVIVFRRG